MTRLGQIIVDGMVFDSIPSQLDQITDEDYGLRTDSYVTVGLKRFVVTESAQIDTPNTYRQKRKIHRQAWRFGWDQNAFASSELHDLIKELYETQRHFWIQADDEMSRCWGRCLTVGNDILDNLSPHVYFTPTYPIFPVGHEPGDDMDDWTDMLMVEGKLWDKPFTVDREMGLVVIQPDRSQFTHRTKVNLKYTWRAYVRIKSVELYAYQLAQTYYVGTIILEQVPIPVMGAEIALRTEPYSRSCIFFSNNKITVNGQLRMTANVRVPMIQRRSVFAQVSLRTAVTGFKYGGTGSAFPKFGQAFALLKIQNASNAYSAGQTFQMLRPDSDTNAIWSITGSTSRWDAINDPVVDETDYITGSSGAQTGTLSPGVDPGTDNNHYVLLSWRRLPPVSTTVTVLIKQGTTLIATATFNTSADGRLDSVYSLTALEASGISDYTQLNWTIYADTAAAAFSLALQIPYNGGVVVKTRAATGIVQIVAFAKNNRSIILGIVPIAPVVIKAKVIAGKSGVTVGEGGSSGSPE